MVKPQYRVNVEVHIETVVRTGIALELLGDLIALSSLPFIGVSNEVDSDWSCLDCPGPSWSDTFRNKMQTHCSEIIIIKWGAPP